MLKIEKLRYNVKDWNSQCNFNPDYGINLLIFIAIFVFLFALLSLSVRADTVPIVAVANFTIPINITAFNSTINISYIGGSVFYNQSSIDISSYVVIPINFTSSYQFSNLSCIMNYTPLSADNSSCADRIIDAVVNATSNWENLTRSQLVPNLQQYSDLQNKYYNETNQLKAECIVKENDLSNTILNDKVMLNASYINYNASLTVINNGWVQTKDDLKFSNTVLLILAIFSFVLLAMVITKMTVPQWFKYFFGQDRIGVQSRQMGKFVPGGKNKRKVS